MFEPKNGIKGEASMLEEAFCNASEGMMITYPMLSRVLGRDIREERGAFYIFQKRMMKKHGKVLRLVKNKGYIVDHPENVFDDVAHDIKRSHRIIDKNCNKFKAQYPKLSGNSKRRALEGMNLFNRIKIATRRTRKLLLKPNTKRTEMENKMLVKRLEIAQKEKNKKNFKPNNMIQDQGDVRNPIWGEVS